MANPIDQLDPIFKAAAAEWNVDPVVLKALALHESGGRVDAVGKSGEQGLMQIMPGTQRQLGVTKPFDAEQSIYGGAKYLAMALDAEHDNPTAALRFYNGGPGWRTSGGDPKYPSYVGVQYQKLAKADTGTLTDATPAPPGASPAATAQADAPDYNNAPAGPSAKPAAAPAGKAPDPYDAALKGKDASGGKAAEPDAYTKALGTPAETAPKEAGTAPEAVGDTLVSPDDMARINAPPSGKATAPTKEDISKLLAPAPNTTYGDILPLAKDNTTGAIRLALPNIIRNPLIGLTEQGPGTDGTFGSSGVTWNPETGTYGLTPEAASVGQFAANPLRFGGALKPQFGPPTARPQFGPPMPEPFGPPTAPTPAFVPPNTSNVPLPPRGAPPADTRPAMIPPNTTVDPVTGEVTPVQQPPTAAGGGSQPGMGPPVAGGGAAGGTLSEHGPWLQALPGQMDELLRQSAEVGGPQSLSAAATPPAAANLTPSAARAYRTMAELNEIGSPIRGPDYSVYTPGVEHTLAEHEGNPLVSQQESLLRQKQPDRFDAVTVPANDQLVNTFKSHAGSSVSIDNLKEQIRQTDSVNAGKALDAAVGKTGDLATIAQSLDNLLGDPLHSEVDAVRKVLVPLREAMNGADGELKTDPRAIWGMWKNVKNAIEKSKADTGNERFVQSELLDLKKGLGDELNRMTNGRFQELNDQHAELAKQLNAYQVLQKKEATLTNKDGTINAAAYHRWLVDLAMRRGRPGIDPAMDIPDTTMRALINIDNDLKLNGRIDLGKARGSPTNLYGEVAKALGLAGVHGLTAAATGGPGIANMAVQQGLGILGSRIGSIRLTRLVNQHLPPATGWPNLLQPPPP